jgi:hypothetical protein
MTSEELAAARISSTGEEVHRSGNIQPQESNPVPATVPDSENREDGEIRSEEKSGGEGLRDVDADSRELIAARRSESFPPSFIFGESKVTTNLIREYEVVGFFPTGDGCAPLDEQIPTREADEVVVFREFFTCRLRFPCDPLVPAILDVFCESSSTITEFVSGVVQVFLGYEDLQM